MFAKCLVFVFLWFLRLQCVKTALEGNCLLEGVTENDWKYVYVSPVVNDSERTVFKTFECENIKSAVLVKDSSSTNYKYVEVILENDQLTVKPSDLFEEYEKNEPSTLNPLIVITINFECNNGKGSLLIQQPILDENTYYPKFDKEEYSYKLPGALIANTNLENFGEPIIACDYDITNMRLDWTIEPEDNFKITGNVVTDQALKKCHKPVLVTSKPVVMKEAATYTITAHDMGVPVFSTPVQLHLLVDPETVLTPNPYFEQPYYMGEYKITEEDIDSVSFKQTIRLKSEVENLQVSFDGEFGENFGVNLGANSIDVFLVKSLPKDTLDVEPIVVVTLEGSVEEASEPAKTVLIINLPRQETTTTTPYLCPTTVIPTECPPCPTTTVAEATTCPTVQECVTPTIVDCPTCPPCDHTTTVKEETSCPTTPTSTCPTCPPCTSQSTPTECPTSCPTSSTCPEPECPTCAPCISTSTPIECPTSCPTVPTHPEPECPTCPPYLSTSSPIECPTSSTCPEPECPTCAPCLSTSTPIECPTSCPTVPTHPEPECPTSPPYLSTSDPSCVTTITNCPTTTTECNCQECNTTTTSTPAPVNVIRFEKDNYFFEVPLGYKGLVSQVKATANPPEKLEYSIVENGGTSINKKLSVAEGKLTILESLDVGTYNFVIHVQGIMSKTEATADAILKVKEESGSQEAKTEYSILAHRVFENHDENLTLTCEQNTEPCIYKLISQYPETSSNFFEILENGDLHVMPLDREMDLIANMYLSQFTLTLELEGSSDEVAIVQSGRRMISESFLELYDGELDVEWLHLPKSLPNKADRLVLSLIVEDENDNDPQFQVGQNGLLVVGYPATNNLIDYVAPPYLTKVYATDKDIGINAEIRYNTSSDYFLIHPKDGFIYPGKDALEDDENLRFSVFATDKDGSDDGRSSRLDIEVKLLDNDNLAVMTLENVRPDEVESFLMDASKKTGIELNHLSATAIPDDDGVLERLLKKVPDVVTRVVVYGLDTKHEPIKTDSLKKSFENAQITVKFVVEELKDVSVVKVKSSSVVGYIVAVSILSFLLVIAIVGFGIFYYLKIYKPKRIDNLEDYNNISETGSASSFDDKPTRRATGFVFNPPPIEEDEEDDKNYEEINNMKNMILLDEITNDQKNETNEYDDEPKKAVHFKETVQKINILVEDQPEDPEVINERF